MRVPRYQRIALTLLLLGATLYSNARAGTYLSAYNLTLNPYNLAGYCSYREATAFVLALALIALIWVFTPQKRGNK